MEEKIKKAIDNFVTVLTKARYKIFVAVRPIGPAREAFDLVTAEFTQDIRKKYGDEAATYFADKFTLAKEEEA